MYDGILRLNLQANAEIIGLTDNIPIVICNQVVHMVANWLNESSLAIAPQKTEAILINSRKVVEKENH